MVKEIICTNGMATQVDDEFYPLLAQHIWYANIPSAARAHDQSGAGELPEVAIARTALANRITEAFRQYRKDLVKAFQKYQPNDGKPNG